MRKPLRILILDDQETDAELMEHALREAAIEFAALRVDTEDQFVTALEEFLPDVVLADYSLPGYDGASALAHVRRTHPEIPVIVVTGAIGDEAAVRLLRDGAKDYLLKDRLSRLPAAIIRAIETEEARRSRKRAEEAIARTNRALRTISRVNAALIHETDEIALVQRVCRTIVEEGDFRFAWIGYAEDGGIRPVGMFGSGGEDYIEATRISWQKDGRRPTEVAVGSGQVAVVSDVGSDPTYAPWRPRALACDYRSVIALPLRSGGKILGVLSIYAGETDAFDPRTVALLEECAADVAFGVGTARERASRRQTEEQLETIAAAAKDAIVMIDNDAHPVFWNAAAATMFGWSLAEIAGSDLHDLVAPERYHGPYRERFAEFRRTGQGPVVGKCVELTARRRDGSEFPIELTLSAVRYNDLWAAIAIIRDITERKATEARLHQADKMDALGNMAGGIAHDLKNMLLPVISLVGLTIKELPADSRPRQRLEKVLEAAERARSLVERIHAFSHVEPPQRETQRVAAVLDEAFGLIRPMVPASIAVEVANSCPPEAAVSVDRGQFDTVLMNLASNAVDAMEGRPGTLAFTASEAVASDADAAHLGLPQPGAYLRLDVADSGKGMDAETCRRVFDLWFSTKEKGKGTGLGLAVVSRIVSEHGGAITVASTSGTGTTFTVFLPLVEAGERRD